MAITFDPQRVAPLVGWLSSAGCDVSGEVLVGGAGLVRRAGVGETDALQMPLSGLATTIHSLRAMELNSHASASDSFTRFLGELPNPVEDL